MVQDRKTRFISDTLSKRESTYNPISGYESVPLMSLEDAVRNIAPFIPDVMSYAATAKDECTKNAKLNINESAAVYLYTMETDFYSTLNKKLRNENHSDLVPWFSYLKLFITALLKLPPCMTTVWRGIRNVDASNFEEGRQHNWWGIYSCTHHVALAQGFTCEDGILFCIESIYGRNIKEYSRIKTEDEVILLPGTSLRVKGKSLTDTQVPIIHLQQW